MEKLTIKINNAIEIELIEGYDSMRQYYPSDEPETLTWIAQHVKGDWVTIDAGAHIGVFTTLLAYLAKSVCAFEPSEKSRNMLKANLEHNIKKLNIYTSKVIIEPFALGNVIGLKIPETLWLTDGTKQYGKTHGEFDFNTLDNYCLHNAKLKRLDFIKCDVDGWDYEVLQGARNTLKKFRPYVIVESNYALYWRNHNQDDMDRLLTEVNYKHRVIDPTPSNWLCWPEEKEMLWLDQ